MIPNILISGNKNKGSSLMSPTNGLGGSRATILFLPFSKTAAVPALRARYRQFTISEFSEVLRTCGAFASPAGEAERAEFERICHAPRGKKETAWFWIWKFVWAKPKVPQRGTDQSFFVSPLAKHGSDNF